MAEIKHNYIFPDFLAKGMAKVDQRTQYEASMMAMTFMMIGVVLSVIYAFVYIDLKMWFKIVLSVNGFFALVFMWSFLVTTYQQYTNFMIVKDFQTQTTTQIQKEHERGLIQDA